LFALMLIAFGAAIAFGWVVLTESMLVLLD
jgi:hypothetical protein